MTVEAPAMPREQASTSIDALALLVLPPLDGLTDAQTRGRTCVRDGVPLTAATVVDLGERMSPLKSTGTDMRWYPRVCRTCIPALALETLHAHAPECEQCVDDASHCEIGVALRRLMREYR
jgi:hypothetical protein